MTILTLNKHQLEKEIGKITPEIEEKITMFGTPVKNITETEISVESRILLLLYSTSMLLSQ